MQRHKPHTSFNHAPGIVLRARKINPLKTKSKLLYLKIQFVPHSKHFSSVIKTNQFMLYVVGSKSFRLDIQKPRQMENVVRDI